MHAVFIPYGHEYWTQWFLMQLMSQKLTLRVYNKETGEEKHIFVDCQLRRLPGGIYEFVFPKEHKDVVFSSLDFDKVGHGSFDPEKEINFGLIKIKPIDYLRKFLKIEYVDPASIKKEGILPWRREFVSIIPLGMREDGEIQVKGDGDLGGWWHEAI